MRKANMNWYKSLNILLIIWMVYEPLSGLASMNSNALTFDLTLGEYLSLDWKYTAITMLILFGDALIMGLISYYMRIYSPLSYSYCKLLIAFSLFCSSLLFIVLMSLDGDVAYAASSFGVFLNKLLIFSAYYFYLKRRIADMEQINRFNAETTIEKSRKTSNIDVPTSSNPFEFVPAKLRGITDQSERDQIIANTLRKNVDPYTGTSITCEAEWDAYVVAYYADKDTVEKRRSEEKQIKSEKPVVETATTGTSEAISLGKIPPEQRYRPCAECGANIPYPEYEAESFCRACRTKQEALRLVHDDLLEHSKEMPHPLYCRLCGAKLQDDSLFCEFCGEPIPTDRS